MERMVCKREERNAYRILVREIYMEEPTSKT
jgi:hypothetical protein